MSLTLTIALDSSRSVQGSDVPVTLSVVDNSTGLPFDPTDVKLVVLDGDGSASTMSLTGGTIVRQAAGVYLAEIDTAVAAPGDFELEGSVLESGEIVRKQRWLSVIPSIDSTLVIVITLDGGGPTDVVVRTFDGGSQSGVPTRVLDGGTP